MMPNFQVTFAAEYFLSSTLDIFCSETSSKAWIVDLFIKIYICSLCTLPHLLFSWSFSSYFILCHKASLLGYPLLDMDLPAKWTRERLGSGHLGLCVANWQCWSLCSGKIYLIGPFRNDYSFM